MIRPPLVKSSTACDDVPLVIERPDWYPFEAGEIGDYREASEAELARYASFYAEVEE